MAERIDTVRGATEYPLEFDMEGSRWGPKDVETFSKNIGHDNTY